MTPSFLKTGRLPFLYKTCVEFYSMKYKFEIINFFLSFVDGYNEGVCFRSGIWTEVVSDVFDVVFKPFACISLKKSQTTCQTWSFKFLLFKYYKHLGETTHGQEKQQGLTIRVLIFPNFVMYVTQKNN